MKYEDHLYNTFIKESIRVNHAGEYGAVCIYHGQQLVFNYKNSDNKEKISEMKRQEQKHFAYFDQLIIQEKICPTIFLPIWHVSGVMLGVTTALMGESSAMACTVAVEEVIANHYQGQLLRLKEGELKSRVAEFREEELEHHDIALEHCMENTFTYKALLFTVKNICKIAIKLSKWL